MNFLWSVITVNSPLKLIPWLFCNTLWKTPVLHVIWHRFQTLFGQCVAVYPQSHSPFSASFQTFCLTARTYLNTQKYGLFCSLLSVLPICSKQALILLIDDCFQNGNAQDPNCNGIHGVLAAYYHSIERVQLHGNISDLQGLLTPEYKRGGGGLPW